MDKFGFAGEKVSLSDVCTKASSGFAQKDLEELEGEYPVYGASGYIKSINQYHQEKEYIAVVKDGAGIGRTMILPAKSSIIGTMQYLLPKENILPRYLYYAVKNMHLEKYYTGATIPHIYFKDYQKEKFNLPDIYKQNEVVEVLEIIEKITEKRNAQLNDLDTLIKARFVEMFGNPEDSGNEWEQKPLSDLLNVIGGYAFKSDQFSEIGGIPVLRIGNINAGVFRPVNMVYWEDDEKLERYAIYAGDLVMSLTGTVGKDDYGNVCIMGNEYDKYYLNQRNAKLEIKSGLDKYYLSELLKFECVKKKLTGISRGVRQANISNKDILNLVVNVPPIELQNQFAAFVTQVDKLKVAVQESLDELQTLFDSLMQQYFG